MQVRLFLLCSFVLFLSAASSVQAQQDILICHPDEVTQWLQERKALSERLDALDDEIMESPVDWRGFPRLNLLITLEQEVRRRFEDLPHPPCANALYVNTLIYWSRRVDHLLLHMQTRQTSDSVDATQDFFQINVLPVIYALEDASGVDYFALMGQERDANAPPPPLLGTAQITSTEVISEDFEGVIDSFQVELPNCAGTDTLEVSESISRIIERKVEFGFTADARASLQILLADVEAHLNTEYNINSGENIERTQTLTLRAAPNSHVRYHVDWVKVSTLGIATISRGDRIETLEFSIPNNLRVRVGEPEQIPCP